MVFSMITVSTPLVREPLLGFFLSLSMSIPILQSGIGKITTLSVSSVAQLCLTLCDPMDFSTPASLSNTNSQNVLKLMPIESVMPSKHLILCCPLLLLSIFPSIRGFPTESALLIRWPKYRSFIFNISPSNEYSGLISLGLTGQISLQSKGL